LRNTPAWAKTIPHGFMVRGMTLHATPVLPNTVLPLIEDTAVLRCTKIASIGDRNTAPAAAFATTIQRGAKMHDAEAATTLLNRYRLTEEGLDGEPSALDMLREGGLPFKHFRGVCRNASEPIGDGMEIECLAFGDGSHALRLGRPGSRLDSATWTAVAPEQCNVATTRFKPAKGERDAQAQ
jgi:hypothetical protein